ncbi:hypothetical protein ACFX1X_022708 [Malus domestica]
MPRQQTNFEMEKPPADKTGNWKFIVGGKRQKPGYWAPFGNVGVGNCNGRNVISQKRVLKTEKENSD